jgi:ketosteroid isomerase-like protein
VRNIAFYLLFVAFISCRENNSHSKVASADTVISNPEREKIFDYPVLYKNWKIGDHDNTRLVLQMYKAWDKGSVGDIEFFLDDTITMDLPDGVRLEGGKDAMVAELLKRRKKYKYASNEILAAYPLVNTDNNDQWVNVLIYNKWMYNDRVRDSMLYQDLWKIRNGKITNLVSLQQKPSRSVTKRLEELIK